MNRFFLFFLFQLLFFSCYCQKESGFNCYTIIVGKNASADGSVFLAHNEDDPGELLVDLHKVPAIKHNAVDSLKLTNFISISQPLSTLSYLWIDMPGQEFSDSYLNESGVAIASNQCRSKANDEQGVIGYLLRKIMAERAGSAKAAVKIAGQLIEKYGYSYSGRTYCIADQNEGWVLEVIKGKYWVAQRVPDDEVMIIPNYYIINEINLKDTVNFLGSHDIIEYAVLKGWYDKQNNSGFNFKKTFSDPLSLSSIGNVARQLTDLNKISQKQYDIHDNLPFSFKPIRKITLSFLMDLMKNHYEDSGLDNQGINNSENPHKNNTMSICSESNQYCYIAQLRKNFPNDIGNIMWFAPRRPCIQPFIPFYFGINNIPEKYERLSYERALKSHFDDITKIKELFPTHVSWIFYQYALQIDNEYRKKIEIIKKYKTDEELEIFREQQLLEKELSNLYNNNPLEAKRKMTEYTGKWAEKILNKTKSNLKNN